MQEDTRQPFREHLSRYIEEDIINYWWNVIANQEARNRFYQETILPDIVKLLQEQLRRKKEEGMNLDYDNLILILGAGANPALIIANAICPKIVTILHTEDKLAILNNELIPNLHKSIKHEIVSLVRFDHQKNYNILSDVLRKANRKYGKILCDITGGKKMMATQLGIIASSYDIDLSYIDAGRRMPNSSVPIPGEEILYIHSTKGRAISEITANPYDLLIINFEGGVGTLTFQLLRGQSTFKFSKRFDATSIDEFTRAINDQFKIINCSIQGNRDYRRPLEELSSIIRNIFIPHDLQNELSQNDDCGIRLLLDSDIAGIPWEIAIRSIREKPISILRMLYSKSPIVGTVSQKASKSFLLAAGSGEGIPGFDNFISDLQTVFPSGGKCEFNLIRAENNASLQVQLAKKHYDSIIYFGHAKFGDTPENTGWICRNGDVFSGKSLHVLHGRAPEVIISNACESARSLPFREHSFAHAAIEAGCRTYIGTNWFLEYDRSRVFLESFLREMIVNGREIQPSFEEGMKALRNKFGAGDISLHNFVYYGGKY